MNFLPCFRVIQSSFNANNSLWVINIAFFTKSFKISFASQHLKLLQLTFSGTPNNFFFCKITAQSSKYFLEISKAQERLKCLNMPFPSSLRCTYDFQRLRFSHFIADESTATRSMFSNFRPDPCIKEAKSFG